MPNTCTGPLRRIASRVRSKSSTAHGPQLVQTTFGSTPKMPSRLTVARRDEPVREQVQTQVGVRDVGRREVEVDLAVHDILSDATLVGAAVRAGQDGQFVWRLTARLAQGGGRVPGVEGRSRCLALRPRWSRGRIPRRCGSRGQQ